MKKNITLILIGILIGGVVFGSLGTVFALTYRASDITYTPTDNTWNVTTVGEAINDLALSKISDNYSEDEKVIGTWVDGKPLYQKSFDTTTPAGGSGAVATLNNVKVNNLDKLVVVDYVVVASDGTRIPESYNTYFNLRVDSTGQCTIWYGANGFGSRPIYITFKYTKTTDTVN